MKGQIEVSFQWIFVLIAGGFFFLMFFFLIRGCAESGDERLQGGSVQGAAERIENALWQPESVAVTSIRPVEVRCPGGRLTLVNDLASAPVDIPVFIPPKLSGRLQLTTRNIIIGDDIPLGSAVFGIDEHTYYLIVVDGTGGYKPFKTLEHENIKVLPSTVINDPDAVAALVPSSANTVVVVSSTEGYVANTDYSAVRAERRRGVALTDRTATFYEWDGGMKKRATMPAEHDLLAVGAAVSGDSGSYACARAGLAKRAHYLTDIYEVRSRVLLGKSYTCDSTRERAIAILSEVNVELGEEYLGKLFANEVELTKLQESLLRQSCGVIA